MGNTNARPPPVVLVPPLFDFPPLAARTRMLVPSYELLFGKLALCSLFEDYFEAAEQFNTRIMLKPAEDPHVDIVATVSAPLQADLGRSVDGSALFRWQRDLDDPHTFMDLFVSTSENILQLRSSCYYPRYGIGAFGILPLLASKSTQCRVHPEDYGMMGVRYGSDNLSLGTSFIPFPSSGGTPICTWLVGRAGRLSAGMQYKPPYGSNHPMNYKNLEHWSCAIGYGLGSTSALTPSFNFCLELARGSQLIASFYQHLVVQRRVNNPFEGDQIVGITNYIDIGFELATRIKRDESHMRVHDSTLHVAASWQANKNLLLKGKMSSSSASITLALKSWWKPSFTFNITAINDFKHQTSYGFGIRIEDLRHPSYERADPNYVMLTSNKEHLAEDITKNLKKRPMFQSEIEKGNFDTLPSELKPHSKIL